MESLGKASGKLQLQWMSPTPRTPMSGLQTLSRLAQGEPKHQGDKPTCPVTLSMNDEHVKSCLSGLAQVRRIVSSDQSGVS
jgi:hypothetical protein